MNLSRRPQSALVPALLLLTMRSAPAAAIQDPPAQPPPVPALEVTAPPELAAAADRIRRMDSRPLELLVSYVGLTDPGAPIRIQLEPEGSEVDRATPDWIAGYAYGSLGLIVLFPDRSPSYPYGSFEEVLLHELAHVLAARAAGFEPVPRWFSEGAAMVGAGTWGLDDQSWLTLAAVLDSSPSLGELETMFGDGRRRTARAYALSGAFVRDLQRRKGPTTVAAILARRALGLSFEDSFHRTVGVDSETAAAVSWRRYAFWHRWVPIVTSSLTLWLGITLLALWAGMRKKRRRAELEARWEAEDATATEPTSGEPPGGWIH